MSLCDECKACICANTEGMCGGAPCSHPYGACTPVPVDLSHLAREDTMNDIPDLDEAERLARVHAGVPSSIGNTFAALMAEYDRRGAEIERLGDALATADQTQLRSDDERGETRDGVMQAIVEAGLAPHVCDDDDLPDMVRHALTAAKQLAQPALWTYNERGEAENQAAPVDWAPRFRAASAAASQEGFAALAAHFAEAAEYLHLPGRAEAVERALIGEDA